MLYIIVCAKLIMNPRQVTVVTFEIVFQCTAIFGKEFISQVSYNDVGGSHFIPQGKAPPGIWKQFSCAYLCCTNHFCSLFLVTALTGRQILLLSPSCWWDNSEEQSELQSVRMGSQSRLLALSPQHLLLSCKKASHGKGAARCLLQILASRAWYHISLQGNPHWSYC